MAIPMPCCLPPESGPLVAVLAAGSGSRFDPRVFGAKLDASLAGKRVGQWVVDAVAAAGLAPGVIVVSEAVPAFASESGWRLLANARAEQGMGTSLAMAAGAALAQGRSLLVLLADMPLVDPGHLQALCAQPCAATLYPGGKAGVPALADLAMLPALAGLAGNTGAGPLLAERPGVALIAPPAAMLLDIDRVEDLAAAEALLTRPG